MRVKKVHMLNLHFFVFSKLRFLYTEGVFYRRTGFKFSASNLLNDDLSVAQFLFRWQYHLGWIHHVGVDEWQALGFSLLDDKVGLTLCPVFQPV